MNCQDISRIADAGRFNNLSDSERRAAETHALSCPRCAPGVGSAFKASRDFSFRRCQRNCCRDADIGRIVSPCARKHRNAAIDPVGQRGRTGRRGGIACDPPRRQPGAGAAGSSRRDGGSFRHARAGTTSGCAANGGSSRSCRRRDNHCSGPQHGKRRNQNPQKTAAAAARAGLSRRRRAQCAGGCSAAEGRGTASGTGSKGRRSMRHSLSAWPCGRTACSSAVS